MLEDRPEEEGIETQARTQTGPTHPALEDRPEEEGIETAA